MILYNEKNYAFKHMYLMCKDILDEDPNIVLGVGTVRLNINTLKKKYPYSKFIGYNFEQLYDGQRFLKSPSNILKWFENAHEHWDYDLDNIKYTKEKYGIDVKYKPLVYTDVLKNVQNKKEPDYDVLFYGLGTRYRNKVANYLKQACPNLKFNFYLPNNINDYVSDDVLDDMVGNSKIILNLLSVSDVQPQSRIFYNLINGKCIVTEKCRNNLYGDLIVEAEYDNLPSTLNYLIESGDWKKYASKASNGFKDLSEDWKLKYWNI